MNRTRLAGIFSLNEADPASVSADAGWISSESLPLPTIDERTALYLHATHEKQDFTKRQYHHARNLILDAMAADITAKSKASLPEEQTLPNRSENTKSAQAAPFADLEVSTPIGLTSQKIVSLREAYVAHRGGLASRKASIFTAAAIAAAAACFLVIVIPTYWFITNQNSVESQIALHSSPQKRDMKALFPSPPRQAETTVAPHGEMRTLTDSDTLITRVRPAHQVDSEEMVALLKRGRELVAAGNIPAARSVLKRVAEAGDASAALELGATYDPIILKGYSGITVAPDLAEARAWYLTARELGSAEASKRLERLEGVDR
jgi:hypothetical protein